MAFIENLLFPGYVGVVCMSKKTKRIEAFKQEIVKDAQSGVSCQAQFFFTPDPDKMSSPPLLKKILGLNDKALSSSATRVLNLLEEEIDKESALTFIDFKWKVMAFLAIQDVLDGRVYKENSEKNMFRQWYFYFESKYILTELILCNLNGFYVSSTALLRHFTEFNLLQNYYHRVSRETNSFALLEEYFAHKRTPSWNTLINRSLPDEQISKPIKKRLSLGLDSLSEIAGHAYDIEQSHQYRVGTFPGVTLQGLYSWVSISLTIDYVLWMYLVNFPMLLHPVDTVAKFGFNGPVGLFVDKYSGELIKKSMPPKDYSEFLNYSNKSSDVKDLTTWLEGHNDLSDVEIMGTWNEEEDGKFPGRIPAYVIKMVKLRGMRESLARLQNKDNSKDNLDPEKMLRVLHFANWKDIYKKA